MRRADFGTRSDPEVSLRDLPRITVRGQTVQGGSVPLRKAPLRSSVDPWSTRRPCGPLAFRRATEGSRVLRKVKGVKRGQETIRFRPFSPIFTIYLTNCVLPISRDTNLTPKCSHSLQQFRCVLLLRTENVNVGVVCCRNIRMAKPLADYADRYARFQCPRSKGMSQLM